jgi:hypothetical protein
MLERGKTEEPHASEEVSHLLRLYELCFDRMQLAGQRLFPGSGLV